ncbi:MAG TPA: 2Fe-2S iron-sulfur cluster-binding protein [Candidatus Didemnitutus sp.]|nr:2Fe-2S iron-sulfur cluster-binding protein [Candidatus Didemnitutus sp.]
MSTNDRDATSLTRREFMKLSAGGGAVLLLSGMSVHADAPPAPHTAAAAPALASSLSTVALTVNGHEHHLDVEPRITLLDALREHLALMGTKKGCDRGQCGACTVLVNGVRQNSCLTLAVMCAGTEVTTVEGLAGGNDLHPLQAAFIKHDAFQCGYCTAGQLCSAAGLLREIATTRDAAKRTLTDAEIREQMSGNLCRCGAYPNIVAAVREAQSVTPS